MPNPCLPGKLGLDILECCPWGEGWRSNAVLTNSELTRREEKMLGNKRAAQAAGADP